MAIPFKKLWQALNGTTPTHPGARGVLAAVQNSAAKAAAKAAAASQPQTPKDLFLQGLYKLTIGVDFQSTNPAKPAVYQVWYVPGVQEIHVTFFEHMTKAQGGGYRVGPTYRYWTITLPEAETMYTDSSKGISVWDNFRVRGTKYGHKKNYAKV